MTISDLKVTDGNGSSNNYSKTETGSEITLKIGDPDSTVTGSKIYVISYSVRGALTYYSDHDELYWNVTGNGWPVRIMSVESDISLPETVGQSGIRQACYTGVSGSSVMNCITGNSGNLYNFKTSDVLNTGEGLTIVFGFPKNIVGLSEPQEVVNFPDTGIGRIITALISIVILVLALVWYMGLPGYIILNWWLNGRDPIVPEGAAHVWFDVPKTKSLRPLTPGETGTLIDENADMRDISATIVDLARRRYFKIVEKKKGDFYFVKETVPGKEAILPHEKILYDDFFGNSDEVRVKDGDFAASVNSSKKLLYEAVVKEKLFEKNPQTVRTIYMVVGVFALITFNLPLALIAFTFGLNMPKKTVFGAQSANIAKALKNFLVSQDRQLEYQAKNQLFFEKLLPYAVAFGVEKIWADRFKDITMTQPDWYRGYGTNTFNSLLLANAISSSMSSFSSAATPVRSSSGFSSGFSGGSSGGGGGGGGGGSW
jgi:uncharacterized protein YodC (DUF2158 family)/phage shock protein PspC (stress-responsive transcriptional regulator)